MGEIRQMHTFQCAVACAWARKYGRSQCLTGWGQDDPWDMGRLKAVLHLLVVHAGKKLC